VQYVFVLEQVLNGLLVGAYYLLIALGLSLIFALGGIVNLAHGGFYAIGAYASGMLTVLWGWHIVPALFAGAGVGAVAAAAVGFPALRVKGLMLVIALILAAFPAISLVLPDMMAGR